MAGGCCSGLCLRVGGALVSHLFQPWGTIRALRAFWIYPNVLTSVFTALSIPLPLSTKKFKKKFWGVATGYTF